MPSAIEESIRECCSDAVTQAVAALAAKYGFDAEEAHRELNLDEIKIMRKRGPLVKKSVSKKATKAKDEKDSSKPKRKITGYLMFSREMRPEVKAQLEGALEEGEKLKPQTTVAALAAAWKELEIDERTEWNKRASEEAGIDELIAKVEDELENDDSESE